VDEFLHHFPHLCSDFDIVRCRRLSRTCTK